MKTSKPSATAKESKVPATNVLFEGNAAFIRLDGGYSTVECAPSNIPPKTGATLTPISTEDARWLDYRKGERRLLEAKCEYLRLRVEALEAEKKLEKMERMQMRRPDTQYVYAEDPKGHPYGAQALAAK